MIFLDTSVCVAASYASHPQHGACLKRLEWAGQRGAACAAHSLAEIFAALTRMPLSHRVRPSDALMIVQGIRERFKMVTLTSSEYIETIRSAAERGLSGGIVYDALLLACARKVQAVQIFTLNLNHVCVAAPDLAERILLP